MRRPIFTSGRPQLVTAPLDILDLRDLNTELQSYVRFVTLFMANQDTVPQTLDVKWQEGSSASVKVTTGVTDAGYMTGGPIKILDRFPLQGDCKLFVSAVESTPAVWGYFELDGASNVAVTTRALLPGNLVSPFTYAPVVLANGDPVETVHEFDTDYFDLINLDVAAVIALPGDFSKIIIADGAGTTELQIANGQSADRIFDGIPMGAMASSGSPGISVDVNTNLRIQAFGSFVRVT